MQTFLRRTKKASLFAVVISIFVGLFVSTAPYAQAAGERYSWANSNTIIASGGGIVVANPFTFANAQSRSAVGTIETYRDADRYCPLRVTLTFNDAAFTKGTVSVTVAQVASPPGTKPTASCQGDEASRIASGAFTTANARPGNGGETAAQKRVDVQLNFPGKKQDAPKSVTFTMKDGLGLAFNRSFTSNVSVDGSQAIYYGTFNDVPGSEAGITYTVCASDGDKTCQTVVKKTLQPEKLYFGEAATNEVKVTAIYNPSIDDATKDQTFGPFKITLQSEDGKKIIQTQEASFQYDAKSNACSDPNSANCGAGGGVVTNILNKFSYTNVPAGKYKICYSTRCIDITKVQGTTLSVDFNFNGQDTTAGETNAETVCAAGALGWILCPVMTLAQNVITQITQLIGDFLQFKPLLAPDNEQGKAIYEIWKIIVGIANILLVIAFLVVVFSQATSIGLSSYGIKKMLPRIIVAAILMNLSFFICALAIDASNILGQGMKGIIDVGTAQVQKATGESGLVKLGGPTSPQIIVTIAGVLITIGIAVGTGAIASIVPILVTVATVILVIFFFLVIRQVLLVLLIIVAPLAFAAMILPNTSDMFTKWRKLFTGLLLLFPIIMGLLYGGIFLANVILATSQSDAGGTPEERLKNVGVLAAALIAIVGPLFGIPYMFKRFLGAASRLAGFVNNPNKGLIDRSRNKAKEMQSNSRFAGAMNYRKAVRGQKAAVRRGETPGWINTIAGGKGYAASARRGAAAYENKEDLEAIHDANTAQKHMVNRDDSNVRVSLKHIATGETKTYLDKDGRERKVTKYDRVAAAQKLLETGNFNERSMIYDSVQQSDDHLFREEVSNQMFKKGDTATLHPSYGGQLLRGTSNGTQGRLSSVAQSVAGGRIKASGLVHDAAATEDVLKVMQAIHSSNPNRVANATAYGIDLSNPQTIANIAGMSSVADAALNSEETRIAAIAPSFQNPLQKLKTL